MSICQSSFPSRWIMPTKLKRPPNAFGSPWRSRYLLLFEMLIRSRRRREGVTLAQRNPAPDNLTALVDNPVVAALRRFLS
jgi:hypothetical protein